jgi:hypothetical protein
MAYSKRASVATTVTLGLLFPRDSHTSHHWLISRQLHIFQLSQTRRAVSLGIVDFHRSLLTRPGSVRTVPATRLSFYPKCLNSLTKMRITYVIDNYGVDLNYRRTVKRFLPHAAHHCHLHYWGALPLDTNSPSNENILLSVGTVYCLHGAGSFSRRG